ncbi:MAG: hypothetical protein GF390_04085 [Candidatus Pacebacteria bacterium]|nr:hypothetical protein [Candidatus Paceibacterota bacterium]
MKNKAVYGRLILLATLIVSSFALLLVRLVDLQLVQGQRFLNLADDNRFYTLKIPAERGVFLDRYQQPLVYNQKVYFQLTDAEQLYAQTTVIDRDTALAKLASTSGVISYQLQRFYRYPWALAHVLGYVGPVTKEDLLADQLLKVNDQVGKLGLERSFDELLRGVDGQQIYEINALNRKQRLVREQAAVPGQDLLTSLDPYLSALAFSLLTDNKGTILIADASNGQLLTLVSNPSFNANDLTKRLLDPAAEQHRQQRVQQFFADEDKAFFNRAISGAYPPGSVFKLVTALAGLDTGAINLGTVVVDEGILKVGDFEYANWYYTQYGRTEGAISLIRALTRSNDIYFYKTAEWVGPSKLAEYARLLGLGQTTGLEIGPETQGLIPDPAWKEKTIGERWYLGNTYHFGIGQGDVTTSPIQILQLVQAIANQGRLCRPSLLQQDNPLNQSLSERCGEVGLKTAHYQAVLKGMLGACSSGGTAYPLFKFNQIVESAQLSTASATTKATEFFQPGAVACKTGTAEFGSTNEQGYKKTHAWLAAIVNVDQSQLSSLTESNQSPATATASAQLSTAEPGEIDQQPLHQQWLTEVQEHGFPEQLVIVALIESDQDQPYREGSHDAAPVVAAILEWMYGD